MDYHPQGKRKEQLDVIHDTGSGHAKLLHSVDVLNCLGVINDDDDYDNHNANDGGDDDNDEDVVESGNEMIGGNEFFHVRKGAYVSI